MSEHRRGGTMSERTEEMRERHGSGLPWLCPDHPRAQIRHIWSRTRSEANWGPYRPRHLISVLDHSHRYECAECARELLEAEE